METRAPYDISLTARVDAQTEPLRPPAVTPEKKRNLGLALDALPTDGSRMLTVWREDGRVRVAESTREKPRTL